MESPERSEAKAEDKGEPEEAVAGIEAGGRRKEIANDIIASTEKSGLFLFYSNYMIKELIWSRRTIAFKSDSTSRPFLLL